MAPQVFLELWQLLSKFHRRIYVLVTTVVFYELLKMVPAAILAIVIDYISSSSLETGLPYVFTLIGVLFGASMLVSVLDMRIEYAASAVSFDTEAELIGRAAKKLLFLPLGYHEKHNTGSMVHALHRASDRLVELMYFTLKEVVPTFAQLAITIIILFWIGWIPALLFLVFVPLFFAIIHRYGVGVQPLRQAYHAKMEEAAGAIGERIFNIRTVQDFAVENRELGMHREMLKEYIRLQRRRMDFWKAHFLYRDIILNVARASIMGGGVLLTLNGQMTAGALVFFITLTERANLALFRLNNFYNRAGDSLEAISRLLTLLREKEAMTERPDARPVKSLKGHIVLRNVDFAYHKEKPVLHGVSFEVRPKQMVAILGRSGAGKSTLVKLLYRHFDVTGGAIMVDGTDIRDYKISDYRSSIASVPQDIEIFNATVRENIAFGSPHATQHEIEKAAKIAYAHDFIVDFPDGYATLVGEKGVRLSGGQKQRVGIARALLAHPSILIFDEATSSLDTESEQLIQRAIADIAKDFTMIVIAHRLSTIERADTIIVLADGRIVEMGSHEDLIAHKGVYTHMRELQQLGEVRP